MPSRHGESRTKILPVAKIEGIHKKPIEAVLLYEPDFRNSLIWAGNMSVTIRKSGWSPVFAQSNVREST